MKPLPLIAALILACQCAWAETATELQSRIDKGNQIPAGRHTLDKSLFATKTFSSSKDAVLIINGDFPAFYVHGQKNIELTLPRIEHNSSASGNSVGVSIKDSKNVTLRGGPIIGGASAIWAYNVEELLLDGLETRGSQKTYGIEIDHCKHPVLRNVKAIGHKCDGVRFLAHNTDVEIVGGEYRDNGSLLPSGEPCGVGIHLGQSWHPRISGRPIVSHNLGSGVVWKSTYSPADYGTMSDLRIDGIVCDGNGYNQIEVRWNFFTVGTVKPKGASIKNAVIRNSKENGIYANCDELVIESTYFMDCATAIGVVDAPAFAPVKCEFVRCVKEIANYK